jgi:hypothetical protein
LALDAEVEQVVNVPDLIAEYFALLLFHGADVMAERRLIAVAEANCPQARFAVFIATAGVQCEHAKPGRALSGGHSTLARRRLGEGQNRGCDEQKWNRRFQA